MQGVWGAVVKACHAHRRHDGHANLVDIALQRPQYLQGGWLAQVHTGMQPLHMQRLQ